jgi:hypothetical protein
MDDNQDALPVMSDLAFDDFASTATFPSDVSAEDQIRQMATCLLPIIQNLDQRIKRLELCATQKTHDPPA